MNITFIRLNMFENISSDAMKPLLFGIIKSLTPAEYEIDFIDERTERLPDRISSDIIAFSVETFTAKRAYILAKKYKTDNNIIVMGGFHACVMPDEILEYADSVIIGDAEGTWERFLADCAMGSPKRKYVSDESIPLRRYREDASVYKHRYYGVGVYQISRGCKFNCDFCSIKTMYKCVRSKTPEMIVEELKAAKERIIFFVDDNLFHDKESAVALFRAIAPLKKKWACQISMDAASDGELLKEMKRAGCFLVLMGFESVNPESLGELHKAANKAVDYDEVIRRIYRNGLLIYGTFVLGCDSDGIDIFDRTYEFAVRNKMAVTNFNPLIPMPGTGVYRRMEEENRLLYKKWWLSDDYRYGETAFLPKAMAPEQLRDGCLRIRTDFYSVPCILKRLFANPVNFLPMNFLIFILANFISRREIHRKQGQLLGGILNETDID
ncbi:MAG: B12-binding domain-containing radical SAM protein [Lachnospiraceae bacterium]|nr:B12-binding domain-containing radical SAM protein [Lachnospiraceae bacterium]MDE6627537.1 B12-binding domain-containing radical SAM protein [Lachnospiraceae bacterium]